MAVTLQWAGETKTATEMRRERGEERWRDEDREREKRWSEGEMGVEGFRDEGMYMEPKRALMLKTFVVRIP